MWTELLCVHVMYGFGLRVYGFARFRVYGRPLMNQPPSHVSGVK